MRWFSVFLLFALCGCVKEESSEAEGSGAWVIDNVNLIDTRAGKVVPGQSVVFEGSTIVSIVAAMPKISNAHARVIDGSGKYLIPSLWDRHIHTSTDTASRKAILPLLIANGITGARSMAGRSSVKVRSTCRG